MARLRFLTLLRRIRNDKKKVGVFIRIYAGGMDMKTININLVKSFLRRTNVNTL